MGLRSPPNPGFTTYFDPARYHPKTSENVGDKSATLLFLIWRLNQPLWNNMRKSKWLHLPQSSGWTKNWNHHPVFHETKISNLSFHCSFPARKTDPKTKKISLDDLKFLKKPQTNKERPKKEKLAKETSQPFFVFFRNILFFEGLIWV